MEDCLQVQRRSFGMAGHALWLEKFPNKFHEMMEDILWPFTNYFVVVYLDDILIFNKSWSEHLQHIQWVMHTLRQHNLYVNFEK